MNESREVWIGLPTDYDSTKTYPILYVLDAEWWFDIAYALTKEFHENQGKSPELIVVGIPQIDRAHRKLNMTFTDSKNNATGGVDSLFTCNKSETGGGLNFLNYIENEVMLYIDSTYSTNGFNSIVGHSLGGYYCAYIMPIQTSFSAFLIYDASYSKYKYDIGLNRQMSICYKNLGNKKKSKYYFSVIKCLKSD